jgi:hypothetical protein
MRHQALTVALSVDPAPPLHWSCSCAAGRLLLLPANRTSAWTWNRPSLAAAAPVDEKFKQGKIADRHGASTVEISTWN